jgi:hypothetical protein
MEGASPPFPFRHRRFRRCEVAHRRSLPGPPPDPTMNPYQDAFLTRGIEKRAEFSLTALAFNLRRAQHSGHRADDRRGSRVKAAPTCARSALTETAQAAAGSTQSAASAGALAHNALSQAVFARSARASHESAHRSGATVYRTSLDRSATGVITNGDVVRICR